MKKQEQPQKEYNFKTITFDDMKEYIDAYAPEDKAWFKEAIMEDGVYRHLKARKIFCEKYMPDIIPKAAQKKPTVASKIANW